GVAEVPLRLMMAVPLFVQVRLLAFQNSTTPSELMFTVPLLVQLFPRPLPGLVTVVMPFVVSVPAPTRLVPSCQVRLPFSVRLPEPLTEVLASEPENRTGLAIARFVATLTSAAKSISPAPVKLVPAFRVRAAVNASVAPLAIL